MAFTVTAVTSPRSILATLYMQDVRAYTPAATGLALLPFSLAVIAGSPAGGRLTGRIGVRRTMIGGLLLIAGAMLLASRISQSAGVPYLVAAITASGCGLGISSVAATAAGTAAMAEDQQGLAAGLLNTAPQLGHALGIAALVTVATAQTRALADGPPTAAALVGGYRLAFVAGAAAALAAAILTQRLVDRTPNPARWR